MIPWFEVHLPGPIHLFGVLVAIGIWTGSKLAEQRAAQLGIARERVRTLVTTVLVSGFVFGHVFDVLVYQTWSWRALVNPLAGLSSFGGFVGALGGGYVWARVERQPLLPFADVLAFGLAPGWMFGRLGCFTAHDHPGSLTSYFLAVQYPGGARHDLGLYEAFWAAAMAALFLRLFRERPPAGVHVTLITLGYAPFRFFADFLRADDLPGSDPRYLGLTAAQYASVGVLVAGVWLARRVFGPPPRKRALRAA